MFYDCFSLTSITFGDGFDTSNVTDMNNMFKDCYSLASITFGDGFDTSNVTNMYSMFWNCCALTELDLTGFTFTEGVYCLEMLGYVGQDYATASGKKTPIYVTQEGYDYLSGQDTWIDENSAELKVKNSAE